METHKKSFWTKKSTRIIALCLAGVLVVGGAVWGLIALLGGKGNKLTANWQNARIAYTRAQNAQYLPNAQKLVAETKVQIGRAHV